MALRLRPTQATRWPTMLSWHNASTLVLRREMRGRQRPLV